MTPTTEKETDAIRHMLDAGAVTSRAAVMMIILGGNDGAYQIGALAVRLGLGVSSVSMLGNTLAKLGLVDRCVPAADLRKTTLALTATGYASARSQLTMLREFGA